MEILEKNWFVVNTYASHENKVKDNIERRIESMGMKDYIFRVVVAEYEEPVLKDGVPTKKYKTKNMYPGYIFIEMIMTDEAWYVVRNTPGVTGFIGSSGKGAKPFPVSAEEIDSVLKRVGLGEASSTTEFKVGDLVKIVYGSWINTVCKIESIDMEKEILTTNILVFNREQEVQIPLQNVEKYVG